MHHEQRPRAKETLGNSPIDGRAHLATEAPLRFDAEHRAVERAELLNPRAERVDALNHLGDVGGVEEVGRVEELACLLNISIQAHRTQAVKNLFDALDLPEDNAEMSKRHLEAAAATLPLG